jgi:hypothetical protein
VTILGQAVLGLARTLGRMAGHEGQYDRKGVGSLPLRATVTARDYELIDDDGVVTRVQSHDWLVVADDLIDLYPPQPGDRFTVEEFRPDQPVALFELMPLGKRPCFEPHDSQGETVVLHTKRVNSAG